MFLPTIVMNHLLQMARLKKIDTVLKNTFDESEAFERLEKQKLLLFLAATKHLFRFESLFSFVGELLHSDEEEEFLLNSSSECTIFWWTNDE